MIEYALIVAGGSGARMQSTTPKQFMELNGLPVLMHTINAFYQYSTSLQIVLVLPENEKKAWYALIEKHHFSIPHTLVTGGNTRFQSVKNGLDTLDSDGIVAIHDGVRPFISPQIIKESFVVARQTGNAVVAVLPKDSIREIGDDSHSKAINRENYRMVQTPQTFNLMLVKKAYAVASGSDFTDDASVVESAGNEITLIEGDYRNIKITTPEDLKIAQALLADINK